MSDLADEDTSLQLSIRKGLGAGVHVPTSHVPVDSRVTTDKCRCPDEHRSSSLRVYFKILLSTQ